MTQGSFFHKAPSSRSQGISRRSDSCRSSCTRESRMVQLGREQPPLDLCFDLQQRRHYQDGRKQRTPSLLASACDVAVTTREAEVPALSRASPCAYQQQRQGQPCSGAWPAQPWASLVASGMHAAKCASAKLANGRALASPSAVVPSALAPVAASAISTPHEEQQQQQQQQRSGRGAHGGRRAAAAAAAATAAANAEARGTEAGAVAAALPPPSAMQLWLQEQLQRLPVAAPIARLLKARTSPAATTAALDTSIAAAAATAAAAGTGRPGQGTAVLHDRPKGLPEEDHVLWDIFSVGVAGRVGKM